MTPPADFSSSFDAPTAPLPPERRSRCRVYLTAGLPRENRLPSFGATGFASAFDLAPIVTRVRTVKTLAQPNGRFEIGLTFAGWNEAFGGALPSMLQEKRTANMLTVPENIVDIAFDPGVPGSDFTSVMQGTITRVVERVALSSDGTPEREIVLIGEDWGKLLTRHDIPVYYFTDYLQGEDEIAKNDQEGAIMRGAPGDVCQKAFDFVFVKRIGALQLKTSQVFAIDIDEELYDPFTAGFIQTEAVWLRQGKFWNLLCGLADEPWNELFADWRPSWTPEGRGSTQTGAAVAPSKFVIRLRRRPFTEALWKALPTFMVPDSELVFAEATLADDERYNWIMVEPSARVRGMIEVPLSFVYMRSGRFDSDDAAAHGAHLMKIRSAYADADSGRGDTLLHDPDEHDKMIVGQGEVYDGLDKRAERLWDMFNVNHRLYRAVWVMHGRPDIRVGTRAQNQRGPSPYFVKEEGERRTYYVEQVIHDFREGHHFFTHLGLTRGQPIDGIVKPWVDGRLDNGRPKAMTDFSATFPAPAAQGAS